MNPITLSKLEAAGAARGFLDFVRQFDTLAEAWAVCPQGDSMLWLLRSRGLLTRRMAVDIAAEYATHALPAFEDRHSGDGHPRAAIQAASAWVRQPTPDKAEAARAAHDALADLLQTTGQPREGDLAAIAPHAAARALLAVFAPEDQALAAPAMVEGDDENGWLADMVRDIAGPWTAAE